MGGEGSSTENADASGDKTIVANSYRVAILSACVDIDGVCEKLGGISGNGDKIPNGYCVRAINVVVFGYSRLSTHD